jgi:Uma2 family endonuclease
MATKTALTWEQFLAAGKPDRRWEYMSGEVTFMSPTGAQHGMTIHQISLALGFLDSHEWICFGADVAFTMAEGDWLCPDAAVVRLARMGGVISSGPVPFPPDVAFEVISPNDTWRDVQRKRRIYHQNGVVQVWIDPQERQVEVISPTHGSRTFREGETAVIDVLPGFKLNLFLPPTSPSEGN